jgi:hypothetical protein
MANKLIEQIQFYKTFHSLAILNSMIYYKLYIENTIELKTPKKLLFFTV